MAKEQRENGTVWAQAEKVDAREVNNFHQNDDVNSSPNAHHHTLGPDKNQASPGDHTHRGGDSSLLFDGLTITGSVTNGTALRSVIALLVELGAADSSTG